MLKGLAEKVCLLNGKELDNSEPFSFSISFCRGGVTNIEPIRAGRNLDDTGGASPFESARAGGVRKA
jgi:hypothetical protein